MYFDFDARFQTKQSGSVQADMHHDIAFLHELGHAKQWIENPSFFNGNLNNTKKFAGDIQNAAKSFWQKKLKINYGAAGKLLRHNALRLTSPDLRGYVNAACPGCAAMKSVASFRIAAAASTAGVSRSVPQNFFRCSDVMCGLFSVAPR